MKFSKINTICRKLITCFKNNSSKQSLTCSVNCCDKELNASGQKTFSDLNNGNHEDKLIACALKESKLAKRKNNLQKEVFSRVYNTKEIDSGFIFSFPYDEQFLLKMTEYIITEKKCCPFFTFETKLRQSNPILLKITGPQESKKMIETFIAEYN